MDRQPGIDISIITYNSSLWLEKFFLSLCQQTYPTLKLNLLIRDNGSTDDSFAKCQRLLQSYQTVFGKIIITQGKNIGFGAGHNQNLLLAKSDFFLVTNVDCEFASDAISKVVAAALCDDAKTAAWEFRQKPYEHPKYYHPVTLETRWNSHACILLRRSALFTVGGYEPRIFLYGEDVELSYRLRDHGYQLKYCPKAVCWHYSYNHAGEIKPQQYFGSKTANIYIRLRYGSPRDILTGILMYCAVFVIPTKIPQRISRLWQNGLSIIKNSRYFLTTRKQSSDVTFTFRWWDYDITREGAFYACNQAPADTMPLVSVIVRTYSGRLALLQQAVTSICNQTYSNVELVIVEDGSDTAKQFIDQLKITTVLTAITYLTIAKSGRSAAGNAGLAAAKGDFLVFLDDDDLFFADHLEVLVNALLDKPSIAAAYSIAYEVKTEYSKESQEKSYEVIYRQPFSRELLWQKNYLPIQSVLFRRELYQQFGGFDLSLDYFEDWHLWLRYSLTNDFLFIPKLTSLYRVPADKKILIERVKKFHHHRALFVKKQQEILAQRQLSGTDVSVLAMQLRQEKTTLAGILLKTLKKFPLLYIFYPWLRRLHAKSLSLSLRGAKRRGNLQQCRLPRRFAPRNDRQN